MSKRKKGISADEKRSLLLEIFHETKEFYQLKDLEKIAVKDKGLKEQAVKEILQALVDEGLVESDKIGSSQYYWSFPAKKRKLKQQELEQLKRKVDESTGRVAELQKRIEDVKVICLWELEEFPIHNIIFRKLKENARKALMCLTS